MGKFRKNRKRANAPKKQQSQKETGVSQSLPLVPKMDAFVVPAHVNFPDGLLDEPGSPERLSSYDAWYNETEGKGEEFSSPSSDEDDDLLDDLLDDDNEEAAVHSAASPVRQTEPPRPEGRHVMMKYPRRVHLEASPSGNHDLGLVKPDSPTDGTSETSEISDDRNNQHKVVKHVSFDKMDAHSGQSSISSNSASLESDERTEDLLERANARVEVQALRDEVRNLKDLLAFKDEEIAQLTAQLKRAVSTKCDLVLAHTELEKCHEINLQARDEHVKEMKRENLTQQEMRAEIEMDFMNKIVSLTRKVQDMERKYNNDILEKDFELAKMEQQMRRLMTASVRPNSSSARLRRQKYA